MVIITTQHLHTDDLPTLSPTLCAGDRVFLSGTVYTARDAAHRRLMTYMDKGRELPFPIKGACIYYAGPTGTPPHLAIGSCGPTTAGRMDPYTPRLLSAGLVAMIGKGERSDAVIQAMIRHRAVYFCAVGGAGALAATCITGCEVIAFEDLGCESVKRLTIREFPLIVGIDSQGNELFVKGPAGSSAYDKEPPVTA